MTRSLTALAPALCVAVIAAGALPASSVLAAPQAGRAKARAEDSAQRVKRQRWPTRRPSDAMVPAPKLGPVPFPQGERLSFDIQMLGAKAGEVVLAVGQRTRHEGQPVVPFAAFLRSTELLSKIYPIDDQLRVLADERTFLPVESTFKIRESGKKIDYLTRFQQARRLVLSDRTKDGRMLARNFTPETPLYDALTSVYAARRLDLKPGLAFDYYVWDGRRERRVHVEAVGEVAIDTPMGKIDTVKVEISSIITGGFIKPSALDAPRKEGTAWFAKDPYRTPVKLQTPTKLGPAEAVLTRRWVEQGAPTP